MINQITSFSGEYEFLSNFYLIDVEFQGETYPSVEHAYQAAKFPKDSPVRTHIRNQVTPSKAKRIGRRFPNIVSNWDRIKISVMLNLLREKFKNTHLHNLLISTGNNKLVEGNYWGDTFWGICNGVGSNNLGILLEEVRWEIQGDWICPDGHISVYVGTCYCGLFLKKI